MRTSMLLVAVLSVAATAGAQVPKDGITVTGTGKAKLIPDKMVIRVTLQGDAEVASDALAQFDSARERAGEAFTQLGVKGLSIAGEGAKIDAGVAGGNQHQVFVMGGGNNQGPATKVHVKEVLRVTVPGIGAMKASERTRTAAKILDAAKDAGLKLVSGGKSSNQMVFFSPAPAPSGQKTKGLVSFTPANADAAEASAYKAALEDARKKAAVLAELSGRKLGVVRNIQVSKQATASETVNGYELEVSLRVVFAMD